MARSKATRTVLLLFLTAGPFLVFLFLYLFGKNRYYLDYYPVTFPIELSEKQKSPSLIIPKVASLTQIEFRQLDRVKRYFIQNEEKINVMGYSTNWVIPVDSIGSAFPIDSTNRMSMPHDLRSLIYSDSIFPIISAKGPSRKKLPELPRMVLLDEQFKVRGVYSLASPLSVDTLMLEFKILLSNPH